MTQYRVHLDVFAGPLDLLLYLVRREEVDIYDIPIAHVTAEYIKYLEVLKLLDVNVAGDFLVMAATLMEIKSAMLLPRAELDDADDQDASDPRAELVRQLLEYKRFKDAANLLEDSAEKRKERFTRPDSIVADLKANAVPELDLDQISIWTLLEAFDNIMQATGRLSNYDHITDDTPIDLYQIEILHRLQTEGPMTFEEIFKDRSGRFVMVGLFLAMLELIRSQLIWVEQPAALGAIYVRSLTEEPAEQAVQRAIVAAESLAEVTAETSDESEQPDTSDEQSDEPKGPAIPIQELPAEKDAAETAFDDTTATITDPDKTETN